MHCISVRLQAVSLFGFISATINTTMVPSDTNIMDIHLVSLKMTTIFGFECAPLNIAMVPNYANIMDMHLV